MPKVLDRKIAKLRSGWYLWIFPVFALMISGWLFWQYFHQRGETITISFDDASGIQAEKTRVRYRGVTIGMVQKVALAPDGKEAVVSVTVPKENRHFAVEGSKFWLVSPKVSMQGLSGLETLFEGAYIAVLPGELTAPHKDSFKVVASGDTNELLDNTSLYYLETNNLESVSKGDSVTFRGLRVGNVTDVTISQDGRRGVVQINIQNRYAKLIRTNTVFWRKVGIQAKLGLFNSFIKVNSLDTIMNGGVEFFTPTAAGKVADPERRFVLNAAPPKEWWKWNPKLEL